MENASKALLIAGEILIALLVISIGVFLFVNYAKIGESYEQSRKTDELIKFNSKFTIFAARTDITAQEIITLANYAKSYNKAKNSNEIKVYVGSKNYAEKDLDDKECTDFIKENSINAGTGKYYYFTCNEDDIKRPSGRVTEIKFTRN